MKAGASELLHSATPQNFSSGNATALSNLVPQLNNQKKRAPRNMPLEGQNTGGSGSGISPLNLTSDDGGRTEQLYAPRQIATTKAGGEDGMAHRRDRRFFQKKDLQLQTTLRKNGHNPSSTAASAAANGMFILSPEQVKFDKDKLQERLLLDTAGANRGPIDQPTTEEIRQSPLNDSTHQRQDINSRALQRNLDTDLS